jgi:uncharacterized repeat protein (TIGR03803 family)
MAGYLRFALFLALATLVCVASGFAGDPLTIGIETSCPPANCSADPGFMGGSAGGQADFNSIGYPWTYNFETAKALTWSQNGNSYYAEFGYGGSFAMTGPGGVTFTGVITSGYAAVMGFQYVVAVRYSGQWSNGLYGYGGLSTFFDPASGTFREGFGATQVAYTKIHDFTGGQDGAGPYAGLTIDHAGNLYGTTSAGGAGYGEFGYGTVYKVASKGAGWTFSPLYNFSGGADGAHPFSRVMLGANGALYGTTIYGGTEKQGCPNGCGTVFSLRPPATVCTSAPCFWTEKVLYPFQGIDGQWPTGDLVSDQAGSIYGTTTGGGGMYGYDGVGVVYRLTTAGVENVLYNFPNTGCTNGAGPYAGVIFDAAGNLYGTTLYTGAGACGYGVVFQLTPSGSGWTENVLQTFQNGNDGSIPYAGLIMDQLGNLYGATSSGGPGGGGTIFEMQPKSNYWDFSTIDDLIGQGGGPEASLVMDNNGVFLYGTTVSGGAYGLGSVFEVGGGDIYDFTGGADGAYPHSNLVLDANGNLYGTTQAGGTNGWGAVFEITVSR